jgi:hypothetical protein
MTAPSMTTPSVAYFHRATRSLRASATMVVLRKRPPCLRTLSWNQRLSAEPGWRRSHNPAGSWPFAAAGFPPWKPLVHGRPIHFAKASAPSQRKPPLVVDWRSCEIALQTR